MTLTQIRPSNHVEAPAVPDPAKVRRLALTFIALGTEPDELRGYASRHAGTSWAPMASEVAVEAGALTAQGLTVLAAWRALHRLEEPEPPAREVAAHWLAVCTPRDVRDMARQVPARSKARFRAIADAMDELTAAAEALQPGNGRQ
jgi:hypothetical protein